MCSNWDSLSGSKKFCDDLAGKENVKLDCVPESFTGVQYLLRCSLPWLGFVAIASLRKLRGDANLHLILVGWVPLHLCTCASLAPAMALWVSTSTGTSPVLCFCSDPKPNTGPGLSGPGAVSASDSFAWYTGPEEQDPAWYTMQFFCGKSNIIKQLKAILTTELLRSKH